MMSPNLWQVNTRNKFFKSLRSILDCATFIRLHAIPDIEEELLLASTFIVCCASAKASPESRINQRQSPNRVWPHSNTGTNFGETFCRLVDLVQYSKACQANRQS